MSKRLYFGETVKKKINVGYSNKYNLETWFYLYEKIYINLCKNFLLNPRKNSQFAYTYKSYQQHMLQKYKFHSFFLLRKAQYLLKVNNEDIITFLKVFVKLYNASVFQSIEYYRCGYLNLKFKHLNYSKILYFNITERRNVDLVWRVVYLSYFFRKYYWTYFLRSQGLKLIHYARLKGLEARLTNNRTLRYYYYKNRRYYFSTMSMYIRTSRQRFKKKFINTNSYKKFTRKRQRRYKFFNIFNSRAPRLLQANRFYGYTRWRLNLPAKYPYVPSLKQYFVDYRKFEWQVCYRLYGNMRVKQLRLCKYNSYRQGFVRVLRNFYNFEGHVLIWPYRLGLIHNPKLLRIAMRKRQFLIDGKIMFSINCRVNDGQVFSLIQESGQNIFPFFSYFLLLIKKWFHKKKHWRTKQITKRRISRCAYKAKTFFPKMLAQNVSLKKDQSLSMFFYFEKQFNIFISVFIIFCFLLLKVRRDIYKYKFNLFLLYICNKKIMISLSENNRFKKIQLFLLVFRLLLKFISTRNSIIYKQFLYNVRKVCYGRFLTMVCGSLFVRESADSEIFFTACQKIFLGANEYFKYYDKTLYQYRGCSKRIRLYGKYRGIKTINFMAGDVYKLLGTQWLNKSQEQLYNLQPAYYKQRLWPNLTRHYQLRYGTKFYYKARMRHLRLQRFISVLKNNTSLGLQEYFLQHFNYIESDQLFGRYAYFFVLNPQNSYYTYKYNNYKFRKRKVFRFTRAKINLEGYSLKFLTPKSLEYFSRFL